MLYPYQDKQTLCVALEDTGEEAISKPVLNIIAFQPLLYVAVIAPLFLSYAAYMVHAVGLDEPEEPLGQKRSIQYLLSIFHLPPHATWTLSTLPLMCVGLATLVAIYMKLRTYAEREDVVGTTYAHFATFTPFIFLSFAVLSKIFAPGDFPLWNVLAICFGSILLWPLALVAYVISFKFIKKPSSFQTWANRCVMIPAFFCAAASVHVVLSGDMWATKFVGPMYVLLALSVACLAVELSAQAYKGREVPVWRYNVSEVMSGAILLMYLTDTFFGCLPLLLK
jgi:membrane protein